MNGALLNCVRNTNIRDLIWGRGALVLDQIYK